MQFYSSCHSAEREHVFHALISENSLVALTVIFHVAPCFADILVCVQL